MEHFEKNEDDLHGRQLPWEMTSITGNQQSIIRYNYRFSPVKPNSAIQLSILAHCQQTSQFEPELGTAQPQLVIMFT